MYKAIIFDLDGTLIDSLEDLANAVNYGLENMGYKPHPLEKYKKFVGNGAIKLCERALAEYTDYKGETEILHGYFSEYYNAHCTDITAPYEGISDLLSELGNNRIRIAVASNKPDEFTKSIISTVFRGVPFAAVYGKRENRETKPAPDIVFDILHDLNLNKEDVILSGDSNVDIMTAANAGIKSIGCTWGFRTREELEEAGADFIVNSPEEILEFVL